MRIREWALVLVLALAAIIVSLTCYAQTPLDKPTPVPLKAVTTVWGR